MTFSAVDTAFKTLFSDSDLRTITPNAYNYDILVEANSDKRKMYFEKEINFFIYLINRTPLQKLSGSEQHTYTVEIKYYLQDNKDGTNQNKINTVFEILHDQIHSVLGTSWSNSVDFYRPQNKTINKASILLDGKDCFFGSFTYEGVKTVTL